MRLCVKYVHTSRVFNYNSGDRNVAHIFKGEEIYERHGTKRFKLRSCVKNKARSRYSLKTTSVITKLIDHHLTNGTERAYVTITMSMNQRVFMPRTNKFASRKDAFWSFFLFPVSIDPYS